MRVTMNSGNGLKTFSTLMVLLAGFAGYAPSVLAQTDDCACMCTDSGAAEWMCSSPFSTQVPQSCDSMQCPVAGGTTTEPPAVDPDPVITDPVTDVTDVVEPPAPGLECNRRNVYRPDLGKYKTYKVCRPEMTDEQKARIAEFRARKQEQWASYQAGNHRSDGDKHNRGRHHGWNRRGHKD